MVKAANISVESYWPSLFAKLFEKRDVEDLILNVGIGGGGAAVAVAAPVAGGGAAAAAPAAEEKKVRKSQYYYECTSFLIGKQMTKTLIFFFRL